MRRGVGFVQLQRASGRVGGFSDLADRQVGDGQVSINWRGRRRARGGLFKLLGRFDAPSHPHILYAQIAAGFEIIRIEAHGELEFAGGLGGAALLRVFLGVREGAQRFLGGRVQETMRGDQTRDRFGWRSSGKRIEMGRDESRPPVSSSIVSPMLVATRRRCIPAVTSRNSKDPSASTVDSIPGFHASVGSSTTINGVLVRLLVSTFPRTLWIVSA